MTAPVSKLDENNRVFGIIPVTGRDGNVHLNDVVISDQVTRQVEKQINDAAPTAAIASTSKAPVTLADGFAVLVVTDKEQKIARRVFIGKREGRDFRVSAQLNLDKMENPSGALQVLTDKGIQIQLIEGPVGAPSEAGLKTLKTLSESGQLVKADSRLYDNHGDLPPPATPRGSLRRGSEPSLA